MNQNLQNNWIAISVRIYRALLKLYPAEYRHEYGGLMVQFFRDVTRERYREQGAVGIALWWAKTLLDLILTVIEQRRKDRFTMSKTIFKQFAGIFLMIGGALIGLGSFSQLQPDDHFTYYGIFQILIMLLVPGYLLVALGCVAMGMRYAQAFGNMMRWSLYFCAVGAITMVIGIAGTYAFNSESLRGVMTIGMFIHTGTLIVFGLLHLQKPVLPLFRALPLMLAGGWLMLTMFSVPGQLAAQLLALLMMLGMGLGWFAIGLTINRQQQNPVAAVA